MEKWANGYEIYRFREANMNTDLTVDLDCDDDFIDYMNQTYPLALGKLKVQFEK